MTCSSTAAAPATPHPFERHASAGTSAGAAAAAAGKYDWEKIAEVPLHIEGNALTIAIPRVLIGPGRLKFSFKWTDNLPSRPQWEDFYTTGDVAPDGRFNFHFEEPK